MNVARSSATPVSWGDLAYLIGGTFYTQSEGWKSLPFVETYDPTKDH